MKIGSVIIHNDELNVVTESQNGTITGVVPLKSYIAKNVMMKFEGEFRTIDEIIEYHCDEYLQMSKLI